MLLVSPVENTVSLNGFENLGLGLSLNSYLNCGLYGLVALDCAFVLANGLDLAKSDVLLVNLDAGGLKGFLDLSGGDRAVDLAGLADLNGHLDRRCRDLGCESLGVSDEFGLFVSPLALCLLKLLKSGWSGGGSESLRDKIVAAVT